MPKVSLPLVLERLREKYPNARYELDWTTPLELLVATILAAQCTDERVNRVTKSLFRKYTSAAAYAAAPIEELEEDVKPTGFYRNKAKAIKECTSALCARFGGNVPQTMDEMVTLPGVARKSANVVLNTAFNLPSGIIVDTHVARIAPRIGLSKREKPEDIEADLMKTVPREDWTFFGPAMVLHGRYTCVAKGPKCGECMIEDICEKHLKGVQPASTPAAAKPAAAAAKSAALPATAAGNQKAGRARAAAADDGGEDFVKASAKAAKAPARRAPEKRAEGGGGGGSLASHIPASWQEVLADEVEKPYFKDLERFLATERKAHSIFPPHEEIFSALELTPYEDVKVLLLGQDPYHDDDQAHGLCFSVRPGIKPPPSLVNIYKELETDVGFRVPNNGYLVPWAKQGILMLNAVLTVRAHTPNSHKDRGWETFTDAVIRKVNDKSDKVVFLLWGGYAQKKEKLIDGKRHVVLKGAHPSPLSARSGFFGSKPFSTINKALRAAQKAPIDWQLPDV